MLIILRRDMTLFIVMTTEQKCAVSLGQPITGKHLSHHTGILYTINTTCELYKQPPSDVEQTSHGPPVATFLVFGANGHGRVVRQPSMLARMQCQSPGEDTPLMAGCMNAGQGLA